MRLVGEPAGRPLADREPGQRRVGERPGQLRRLHGGQEPLGVALAGEGLVPLPAVRGAVVGPPARPPVAEPLLDAAHGRSLPSPSAMAFQLFPCVPPTATRASSASRASWETVLPLPAALSGARPGAPGVNRKLKRGEGAASPVREGRPTRRRT